MTFPFESYGQPSKQRFLIISLSPLLPKTPYSRFIHLYSYRTLRWSSQYLYFQCWSCVLGRSSWFTPPRSFRFCPHRAPWRCTPNTTRFGGVKFLDSRPRTHCSLSFHFCQCRWILTLSSTQPNLYFNVASTKLPVTHRCLESHLSWCPAVQIRLLNGVFIFLVAEWRCRSWWVSSAEWIEGYFGKIGEVLHFGKIQSKSLMW